MLKAQDIVVLLKLAIQARGWTFQRVARELGLSSSVVHRSVERVAHAGLYRSSAKEPNRPALLEFLEHGIRYAFPPVWEGEARGTPTAWAAPPLSNELAQSGRNPPVWPDPRGSSRGIALKPLHPVVPAAARRDRELGELLALVDALRIGGARERNLAMRQLKKRIGRR